MNIRGAADHVHPPLTKQWPNGSKGAHGVGQDFVWKNDLAWATEEEVADYVAHGYRHGPRIQTPRTQTNTEDANKHQGCNESVDGARDHPTKDRHD